MANLLIVGCGALGAPLATELAAQGHQVFGLRRNPPTDSTPFLRYFAADITQPATLAKLPKNLDLVLFIVSADGRTEASYHAVYNVGVGNALTAFPEVPWIFVSSTSVYGQNQGEWVNENSPAEPLTATAQLIRAAELRITAAHPESVVVRFSGIYGPGRNHLLRQAALSPEIQRHPPYWTNRIHAQDCVGVLAFLCAQRLAGAALQPYYLASDNEPVPLWDVIAWLAARMDCPPPRPKMVAGNTEGNKRCDNRRLKTLGYRFRYPSFKDGYGELV